MTVGFQARDDHRAAVVALLDPNGSLLSLGGQNYLRFLNVGGNPARVHSAAHAVTVLEDGRLAIAGKVNATGGNDSWFMTLIRLPDAQGQGESFTHRDLAFGEGRFEETLPPDSVPGPGYHHRATLLPTGRILAVTTSRVGVEAGDRQTSIGLALLSG